MTKYSSKKPQKMCLVAQGCLCGEIRVGGGNVLILSDIAWCAHVA